MGWRDAAGVHPIKSQEEKDGNTVLRTIRHALAHGNVVYLDKDGHEVPGNMVRYLACLSKHESGDGHRVVIFEEESFLSFLKAWIVSLQDFPPEIKSQVRRGRGMKLKFDPSLQYQQDAVNAVVGVFDGQPFVQTGRDGIPVASDRRAVSDRAGHGQSAQSAGR